LYTSFEHQSVLLQETLEYLKIEPKDQVVDGTLGLGGHALSILGQLGSGGHYYGFDLDETNLAQAKQRLKEFSSHVTFFHDNFAHCQDRLNSIGVTSVSKILLDLGLSSPHVDDSTRGFSLQKEGPLDMRFDRSSGMTAAEVLNTWSEEDLRHIFYRYGEERYAPKAASLIVERRREKKFETTSELRAVIHEIMTHPADERRMSTRIFQALRIAVNDELEVLGKAIPPLLSLLKPGGRMVVLSYHSLEDRIVKQAFKYAIQTCHCPPQVLQCTCPRDPSFRLLTKKPIVPSDSEIQSNPRSRSAKLRAIERL